MHRYRRTPSSAFALHDMEHTWETRLGAIAWHYLRGWLTVDLLSVRAAHSRGLFWTYGWGPLLVLLSSVVHWVDPRRDSWRRSLDIWTVRTGMTGQWLIAIFECARGRLPLAGVGLLMLGYSLALPCYAIGRVLTVRRRNLAGACVHGGLHVFSNAGNLLMLRLVF